MENFDVSAKVFVDDPPAFASEASKSQLDKYCCLLSLFAFLFGPFTVVQHA